MLEYCVKKAKIRANFVEAGGSLINACGRLKNNCMSVYNKYDGMKHDILVKFANMILKNI